MNASEERYVEIAKKSSNKGFSRDEHHYTYSVFKKNLKENKTLKAIKWNFDNGSGINRGTKLRIPQLDWTTTSNAGFVLAEKTVEFKFLTT